MAPGVIWTFLQANLRKTDRMPTKRVEHHNLVRGVNQIVTPLSAGRFINISHDMHRRCGERKYPRLIIYLFPRFSAHIPLKPTCWDVCVVCIIPLECLVVAWLDEAELWELDRHVMEKRDKGCNGSEPKCIAQIWIGRGYSYKIIPHACALTCDFELMCRHS